MKAFKKIALLVLALSACYIFLNQVVTAGPHGPGLPTCTEPTLQEQNASSNTKRFNFSCLPPLTTNSDAPDTAFYRIFFSLGDGRFWMGTLNDFKNRTFPDISGNPVNHDRFAEFIAAYDDSEDPKKTRRAKSTGDAGNDIMGSDPFFVNIQNGHNRLIKLQSTSEPSPGDSITYIITYQGSSYVRGYDEATSISFDFKYDSTKLAYLSSEVFRGESVTPHQNTGTINVVSNSKPGSGNQRNIFLYFRTKPSQALVGQTMNPLPNVHYFIHNTANGSTSDIDQDEFLSQSIVASHDPSYKIVTEIDSSVDFSYVDYTIYIQNDGNTRIDKITVEDMLDVFFKDTIGFPPPAQNKNPQSGQTVMASKTPIQIPPVKVIDRNHTFYWDNINLRGLREQGFGHQFTEPDTKARFTFRCYLDTNYLNNRQAYRCNALCNQARIKFGCTPVSKTNIEILDLKCSNNAGCISSDTNIYLTTMPAVNQAILPSDLATALNAKFKKFKWYPAKGLSNPLELNASNKKIDQQEYTLVASNDTSCERLVLHLHLPFCNLGFIIQDSCNNGNNFLVATATGYSGDGRQLVWQNCQTGKILRVPIYANTEPSFYFGLTDTTGCTAEANFQVSNLPVCTKGNNWVIILLTVIGVLLGILVIRALLPPKAADNPV